MATILCRLRDAAPTTLRVIPLCAPQLARFMHACELTINLRGFRQELYQHIFLRTHLSPHGRWVRKNTGADGYADICAVHTYLPCHARDLHVMSHRGGCEGDKRGLGKHAGEEIHEKTAENLDWRKRLNVTQCSIAQCHPRQCPCLSVAFKFKSPTLEK